MKLEIAVIIVSIVVPLCFGSCNAGWWIGNDNGKAYKKYMRSMRQHYGEALTDEEIYRLGWY